MSKNLWDFLPTVEKWFDAENLKTYQKEAKQLFWWRLLVPTTCPNYIGTKKKYLINVLCIRLFGFSHQSVFFLIYFVSQRTLEGKIES